MIRHYTFGDFVKTISLLFLFVASPLFATEIHLSPDGNDSNPGTVSAPVQSLQKARQLAQTARKENPDKKITLFLHPGIYMIRDTVRFTKGDSGTPDAPLVIEGWTDSKRPNDKAHLVGGVVVPGWKKSDDFGRDDVYEADLKPLGITKKFRQIYLNGTRQIWARYPNFNPDLPYSGGWAYVDGVRPPMYKDIEGERCDLVVLRQKDLRKWARPTDGEVCIFPRYNWWNRIEKIKGFDPATRTITLERAMMYAARPEDRFAVFGMKEELDSPGEWYQDVENQKLYFIPPKGTDLAKSIVTVPTVDSTLHFNTVSNVTLRNLEFSAAEQEAVRFNSSTDCVVEKSLIHDLGYFSGGAISIFGGQNCTVRGCDIWNIGGHGVNVSGGNAVQMIKCNHVVDNCYIHHVGQFNRHGLGIMVSGAGVVMSHNLIHDTPRCGIFHGGVLHLLEYNRIRHCNMEMEDTGCTYGGGWTGGWTTIRYNHCTDSIGFNNHGKFFVFAWGIYLDESGCAFDVYGNIVERCQVGAMHLHNARENHIRNNIFANNAGKDGKSRQISFQGWNNHPDGVFLRDRQPRMLKAYNNLLTNPEWKKKRGMHVSPEDPFLPDGNIMRGNKVERNIIYYPDQPDSAYVSTSNVNLEANKYDYNVVWNGGKTPVITGRKGAGKAIADLTDRLPQNGFEPAEPDKLQKDRNQTPASGWFWYHKTFPEMKSELVTSDGQKFFKMNGAFNPENRYIKYTCVKSNTFTLEPGKDYRLSFDQTQTDQNGHLYVRVVTENKGLWLALGANSIRTKSGQKTRGEVEFRYPAKGEAKYDDRIGPLNIQMEFCSKEGTVEFGNFKLEEVKAVSEWEAWQLAGADVHSVIADPLFEDAKNGNFRLKPDSPALNLGFRQIPQEKIGPYKSDARATWPIQEAEGVRENPQWLTSVPINE